jgi:ATP-dependent helicase/nuclease subunit A
MRAVKSEIKRDMEMDRDEVRVMTVHGAKGLEAPIVFLADTTTRPESHHPPSLLSLPAQTGAPPLVWARGEKEDVGPMNEARVAARAEIRNEYRRLLYVAMTRAAEHLIVCGVESKKRPEGCWYDLVLLGLQGQPGFSEHETGGLKLWRYRKVEPSGPPKLEQHAATPIPDKPDWLKRPLAAEPRVRVLAPSSEAEIQDQPRSTEGSKIARKRGLLAHRLLQSLPDIPRDGRAEACADFLGHSGAKLDPAARSALGKQVTRVLEDPRFAELFAPGSRAEVPIVGRVEINGETIRVSGQVDRLVVTQDAVLIGDFKTGRPADQRLGGYVRQLALYRAVLEKIYPDRPIRAALIWTEVPDLMEVSAAELDAALARVTSA